MSDLALVLALLISAIVMFAIGRPRMDSVALMMIVALPLGFITVVTTVASFQKIFSSVPAVGYWAQHNAFKDALASGATSFGAAKSVPAMEAVVRNTFIQGTLSIVFLVLALVVITTSVLATIRAFRSTEVVDHADRRPAGEQRRRRAVQPQLRRLRQVDRGELRARELVVDQGAQHLHRGLHGTRRAQRVVVGAGRPHHHPRPGTAGRGADHGLRPRARGTGGRRPGPGLGAGVRRRGVSPDCDPAGRGRDGESSPWRGEPRDA